uniref:Uncharacterized protein n=1 Tax=Parastrongyloides trichosuri TaxID=131310 RepID=A0A0N4ZIW1_PARTI
MSTTCRIATARSRARPSSSPRWGRQRMAGSSRFWCETASSLRHGSAIEPWLCLTRLSLLASEKRRSPATASTSHDALGASERAPTQYRDGEGDRDDASTGQARARITRTHHEHAADGTACTDAEVTHGVDPGSRHLWVIFTHSNQHVLVGGVDRSERARPQKDNDQEWPQRRVRNGDTGLQCDEGCRHKHHECEWVAIKVRGDETDADEAGDAERNERAAEPGLGEARVEQHRADVGIERVIAEKAEPGEAGHDDEAAAAWHELFARLCVV